LSRAGTAGATAPSANVRTDPGRARDVIAQSRQDFVARYPDGRQELIQACWDVRDPATLIREQEALDEAKRELGLEGRILTMAAYLEEQAGAGQA